MSSVTNGSLPCAVNRSVPYKKISYVVGIIVGGILIAILIGIPAALILSGIFAL